MFEKIEKRIVTRKDVMAALALPNRSGVETRPQLKQIVVSHVWGVEGVYGASEAIPYVNGLVFGRTLAEMVDDGTLVKMDGWELEKLAPDMPVTRSWHYFMSPERAQRLHNERALRALEERRREAAQYARELLVKRHREEYDGIVAERFAALKERES